ncbi:MAG: HRDC domain-containing protein [Planctomycetota bacterium]
MRVNIVTLPYSVEAKAFDTLALDRVLTGRDIREFREHCFMLDGRPHLVCIALTDGSHSIPEASRRRAARPVVTEDAKVLYEALRSWRRERAKSDGIPPYVVLTNRILQCLITDPPRDVTSLGKIDGVGTKTLERYGESILQIIREVQSSGLDLKPRS